MEFTLGDRLRVARGRSGLTQGQLAEALGVKTQTVGNWERDVTEPTLPLSKVRLLCDRLGISFEELTGG